MLIRDYRDRHLTTSPVAMPTLCARLSRHRHRVIIDRFKSHAVGSHALDQPVGLPIVDLPSTVPVANRLLHIGLGQMPLVQPKYRVRTPNESFNSHVAKILRLFQDAASSLDNRTTQTMLFHMPRFEVEIGEPPPVVDPHVDPEGSPRLSVASTGLVRRPTATRRKRRHIRRGMKSMGPASSRFQPS
jgi:hypothetical protein